MKIRSGFVSNSSSSSFIVINAQHGYEFPTFNENLIVDSSLGEIEFGWGPDTIYSVGSRITFSYIQALYANKKEWIEMLEKVIKENCNVKTISWDISIDYRDHDYAYIDHQSSAEEGQNIEMFESEQKLKDFIFGTDSKIELDNDNY